MGKLTRKLRIGEKIGLGFGLVGLIFLTVVWQYHNTLQRTLADHQRLQDVFEERKSDALTIENSVLRARHWEKSFLLQRDEADARKTVDYVQQALDRAGEMAAIDDASALAARLITQHLNTYQQRFLAVVEAWRTMGLDHNSGLQGAFRHAVHQLEAMAGQLKADRLYLLLLQIRRGEKDLGLRREAQYRDKVLKLIDEFSETTSASELEQGTKVQLLHEIESYREALLDYAELALAGGDIAGGKGPFRQIAHRIERLISSHHVPTLGHDILQLRRREKDYLLRGDKQYVEMALAEIQAIQNQLQASAVPPRAKARFTELLQNYQRDFLALVEQNGRIMGLTEEMRQAVAEIGLLVKDNVEQADRAMTRMAGEINATSTDNERLMLWSVLLATLLGILFAITITLHIVRPLRRMAGILDQLAFDEPAERLQFFPEGRDEVNAMAGSVNTMADHKVRFITWWQTAMQEAEACERLAQRLASAADEDPASSVAGLQKIHAELQQAIGNRNNLLQAHYQKLHRLNAWIIERAEKLLRQGSSGEAETALDSIRYSARLTQNILEMILHRQAPD